MANIDPTQKPRPRNLNNRVGPSVKCYRNALYVVLFTSTVLTSQIDKKHKNCDGKCMVCQFRDLASRFLALDNQRLRDIKFDDDVNKFWEKAMSTGPDWQWEQQNDLVEYMERMFGFFEEGGEGWFRELLFPTPKVLTKCHECSLLVHNDYSLKHVYIPITSENPSSSVILHAKIAATYPENATDGEKCNRCDRRTVQDYARPFERVPRILPIHIPPTIDRECFSSGPLDRLDQLLAFSSYPDAKTHPEKVKYTFYRLHGVILYRRDTLNGGHYMSAVQYPRDQDQGGWLLFDDLSLDDNLGGLSEQKCNAQSEPITLQQIEQMQRGDRWRVYALFYEQVFDIDASPRAGATSQGDAAAGEDVAMDIDGFETADESFGAGEDADGEANINEAAANQTSTNPADTNQADTNQAATHPDTLDGDTTTYGDPADFSTEDYLFEVFSPLPKDEELAMPNDPATGGSLPTMGNTDWANPEWWANQENQNHAANGEPPTNGNTAMNGAAKNQYTAGYTDDLNMVHALSNYLAQDGAAATNEQTPDSGPKRADNISTIPPQAKRRKG